MGSVASSSSNGMRRLGSNPAAEASCCSLGKALRRSPSPPFHGAQRSLSSLGAPEGPAVGGEVRTAVKLPRAGGGKRPELRAAANVAETHGTDSAPRVGARVKGARPVEAPHETPPGAGAPIGTRVVEAAPAEKKGAAERGEKASEPRSNEALRASIPCERAGGLRKDSGAAGTPPETQPRGSEGAADGKQDERSALSPLPCNRNAGTHEGGSEGAADGKQDERSALSPLSCNRNAGTHEGGSEGAADGKQDERSALSPLSCNRNAGTHEGGSEGAADGKQDERSALSPLSCNRNAGTHGSGSAAVAFGAAATHDRNASAGKQPPRTGGCPGAKAIRRSRAKKPRPEVRGGFDVIALPPRMQPLAPGGGGGGSGPAARVERCNSAVSDSNGRGGGVELRASGQGESIASPAFDTAAGSETTLPPASRATAHSEGAAQGRCNLAVSGSNGRGGGVELRASGQGEPTASPAFDTAAGSETTLPPASRATAHTEGAAQGRCNSSVSNSNNRVALRASGQGEPTASPAFDTAAGSETTLPPASRATAHSEGAAPDRVRVRPSAPSLPASSEAQTRPPQSAVLAWAGSRVSAAGSPGSSANEAVADSGELPLPRTKRVHPALTGGPADPTYPGNRSPPSEACGIRSLTQNALLSGTEEHVESVESASAPVPLSGGAAALTFPKACGIREQVESVESASAPVTLTKGAAVLTFPNDGGQESPPLEACRIRFLGQQALLSGTEEQVKSVESASTPVPSAEGAAGLTFTNNGGQGSPPSEACDTCPLPPGTPLTILPSVPRTPQTASADRTHPVEASVDRRQRSASLETCYTDDGESAAGGTNAAEHAEGQQGNFNADVAYTPYTPTLKGMTRAAAAGADVVSGDARAVHPHGGDGPKSDQPHQASPSDPAVCTIGAQLLCSAPGRSSAAAAHVAATEEAAAPSQHAGGDAGEPAPPKPLETPHRAGSRDDCPRSDSVSPAPSSAAEAESRYTPARSDGDLTASPASLLSPLTPVVSEQPVIEVTLASPVSLSPSKRRYIRPPRNTVREILMYECEGE
ncbi:hypothetical protein DIPPA_11040 [Diplonema papillatum]|nr:hypothetical protein DIPPA_11040 [Diplonema papillatum]